MRAILVFALTLYIGILPIMAQASEMTVAEAYIAQNHQRTQFDQSRAKMNEADAKYLDHFFFVSDLAFRERMVMLRYFRAGQDDKYIATYNDEIGTVRLRKIIRNHARRPRSTGTHDD